MAMASSLFSFNQKNLSTYCCCAIRFFSVSITDHRTATNWKATSKVVGNFGMDKNERRYLKRRLLQAQEHTSQSVHPFSYKELYPWKDKFELAEYLMEREVFQDGRLIAINKPYGLPRSSMIDKGSKSTVQTLTSGGITEEGATLEDALEVLKKKYNSPELSCVYSNERWTSGLIILVKNVHSLKYVQKCFRRSLAMQEPRQTFWAVTHGKTMPEVKAVRVGIKLTNVQHGGKVPIIVNILGKNEVKRGEIKSNIVEHRVLNYHQQNDVSLTELKVQNVNHHFPRVWLSYCYSPILGDLVYGGRVRIVARKRLQVSPHNAAAYQPPDVNRELLKQLNLTRGTQEIIPCHLHMAKLSLKQYNKDTDLELTAAPPDHFIWSATQLGLMSEEVEQHSDSGFDETFSDDETTSGN